MRLAYLHGAAIPSRAASTVQVMKMCEAFALNGHSVLLLSPHKADVEREVEDVHAFYGVQPLAQLSRARWPSVPGRAYLSAIHMARMARDFRPDVVYSRFVLAGYAAACMGLRVIHEIHRPIGDMSRGEQWAFRRLASHRGFQYAVTISGALRNACIREVSQLTDRLVVAHDGADAAPPGYGSDCGSSSGALQVGYIGSLYPGKGAELIVELARRCYFAEFHVIGGQPVEVQRLRDSATGIENIHLLGYLPHPQAKQRLAAFDVVLAPYGSKVGVYGDAAGDVSAYMSPLKLFEYMAAGKAIVCSDHEVLREVITDGVNALVCKRDAVDDWCAALTRLANDSRLRTQLGAAARAEFIRKYTWSARAFGVLARLQERESRVVS